MIKKGGCYQNSRERQTNGLFVWQFLFAQFTIKPGDLILLGGCQRTAKGAIGKVLPGRELKLAEDGEILVRGENLAAGYWQGKQLTPVSAEGEWFRTGDVGALDADRPLPG